MGADSGKINGVREILALVPFSLANMDAPEVLFTVIVHKGQLIQANY